MASQSTATLAIVHGVAKHSHNNYYTWNHASYLCACSLKYIQYFNVSIRMRKIKGVAIRLHEILGRTPSCNCTCKIPMYEYHYNAVSGMPVVMYGEVHCAVSLRMSSAHLVLLSAA